MARSGSSKMGLTEQQRLFAYAYFNNGGNATDAAIEAGYSKKTAYSQGSRLLNNAEVQNLLSSLHKKLENRTVATKERLVAELAKTAFFNIKDLFDDDGNLINIKDLSDDAAGAVAGIETSEVTADGMKIADLKKIKINPKVQAIAEINKMLGYYAPTSANLTLTNIPVLNIDPLDDVQTDNSTPEDSPS